MKNPWLQLPNEPPFVLDEDKEQILRFNKTAKTEHQIHLELLPEPFLGNPQAKIVLLNLNPGFDDADEQFHCQELAFIGKCRENLIHADAEYPFYLLDPELSESPGFKWWSQRFRTLIEKFGLKTVASQFCCVEFFPYHSKKYNAIPTVLYSQEYGFHLVRKAIERSAFIVLMRAERKWLEYVSDLRGYGYHTLNSAQNVTISSRNLRSGYDELELILGEK